MAFRRREVPDGVWMKCAGCGEILYRREVERRLWTCGRCGAHFRISAADYVAILADEGSFTPLFGEVQSVDPLEFSDARGRYADKLLEEQAGDPAREAVVTGRARIESQPLVLAVMDFHFLGGSMGSVVGERIARAGGLARRERIALVILSCSGGARMHEGILSLMQMAKTCAELGRLHEEGVPYISILADPTTGGVSASFAMLGDVILAEPNALIGFAGPRVIRETIREELPPGFQRAEFTQEHGFVDLIVPRGEMRATLGRLLRYFADSEGRRRHRLPAPPAPAPRA
ncbi:MAG: acetyl-CoA carboxylase carboxyltransferase subunit beta [Candidatus Eisenbacteria bacterium]|uniref:Acetyl-coenzyme A carboxylase carboxyl transferase subunit beta n=1 Tax=Eiseniibacteriota bacterium TaxID=2212470 RepID=A0A937XAQ8_UNCEI|nr:acetyl-CoA carboxylase carboxyltransferase subunit beta [Candidatus Eisenbacteria bacterium]